MTGMGTGMRSGEISNGLRRRLGMRKKAAARMLRTHELFFFYCRYGCILQGPAPNSSVWRQGAFVGCSGVEGEVAE